MAADPSTASIHSSLLENTEVDEAMFGADKDDVGQQQQPLLTAGEKPPPPLPYGWFLKESHSNPGYYYYFNQDTGECCWDIPVENTAVVGYDTTVAAGPVSQDSLNATAAAAAAAVKSILKRSSVAPVIDSAAVTSNDNQEEEDDDDDEREHAHTRKKSKHHDKQNDKYEKKHHRRTSTDSAEHPKEVRVLHILKKHTGSRRPSSWRIKDITISKEKAIEELRELKIILQEIGDAEELRATFEELAKTESDCSSAKRGGDLGFFGKSELYYYVGSLLYVVDCSMHF